jgi:hypothetical protein
LDRARVLRHYETLMRIEFRGRNVQLLDTELVESTVNSKDKQMDGRKIYRHLCKVEYDRWTKESDPVLTKWQRFMHWLLRKEYPKAEVPPRDIKFFSMSPAQYRIFEYLYVLRRSTTVEVSDVAR